MYYATIILSRKIAPKIKFKNRENKIKINARSTTISYGISR